MSIFDCFGLSERVRKLENAEFERKEQERRKELYEQSMLAMQKLATVAGLDENASKLLMAAYKDCYSPFREPWSLLSNIRCTEGARKRAELAGKGINSFSTTP